MLGQDLMRMTNTKAGHDAAYKLGTTVKKGQQPSCETIMDVIQKANIKFLCELHKKH